jgi:hypothetical protein
MITEKEHYVNKLLTKVLKEAIDIDSKIPGFLLNPGKKDYFNK